ncbi:uncharacterized protein isoform X2 [Rhodnius prolixus]|uniref:uncharacterized protein isoform X2 n=1 Tax=Rhodnius prolixus TaxID=13249 RepID=UPI003D18D2B3
MEPVIKEGNLKNRLDKLENQLLALHATLAKKKKFAIASQVNDCSDSEKKLKKGQRQPVHEIKVVRSRYQKTSEKRLTCNEELYNYLANLTKHIANGSNAVRKLADLSQQSESPSIKTILLPREYFYNLSPELKEVDANFALEVSGGENPMLKLCKKFSKDSTSRGCECGKWKRTPLGINQAATVGTVQMKKSPACRPDFNSEKRTERDMAVLEMGDKMKRVLQMKNKSTKIEEKSKPHKHKLMRDREQQAEEPQTESMKDLAINESEFKEDLSGKDSPQKRLNKEKKTLERAVQLDEESISIPLSSERIQGKEKKTLEKAVQLDGESISTPLSSERIQGKEKKTLERAVQLDGESISTPLSSERILGKERKEKGKGERKEKGKGERKEREENIPTSRSTDRILRKKKENLLRDVQEDEKSVFTSLSSEKVLGMKEKTLERHVQQEESISTPSSPVNNQELEKKVNLINENLIAEKQIQTEYKKRADAAERALTELQAKKDAENEAHTKEIMEMKKLCDQLELTKNKLQQNMSLEVQKLTEKNQAKVHELTEKLKTLNQTIEKCEDKIQKLVHENKAICNDMKEVRNQKKEKLQNINQMEKENITYRKTVEVQNGVIDDLKKKLDQSDSDLKLIEKEKNDIQAQLKEKVENISSLEAELSASKDLIKIKDTMLNDQLDTIKTIKSNSEISKEELLHQQEQNANYVANIKHLEEVNTKLRERITQSEENLRKANSHKANHEKNIIILKKLEKEICDQQKQWHMNMAKICKEKDDAVRTARFASKKLVQSVNDYESQIKAQKQVAELLKCSLNEKEKKLDIANQQIEVLNAQVWKSNQMSEHVRTDLRCKLKKACEVYTDLLEDCCTNTEG